VAHAIIGATLIRVRLNPHRAAISLFMLPVLLIVVVTMLRFIRRREI
jgi:hypothetical protein